jgi:hypothetical protein
VGAVYIVHSLEDTGRFVAPLATVLARAELEPVTHNWALAKQDSLIERIFAEGLKGCELAMVILSRFNADAGWSQFELEKSVTDRIRSVTRLAFVLLDDRDHPADLPDIPSFRIVNPGDLVELSTLIQELGPVLSGQQVKSSESAPSPGGLVSGISGVGDTEATVLALSCRRAIECNSFLVKADDVSELAAPLDLDSERFQNCLDLLETAGHIRAKRANGGLISTFEVDRKAFGHYLHEVIDNVDDIVTDLASEILAGVRDNKTLVERFDLPGLVVTYILDDLDSKGHITVISQMKGNRRIKRVSPEFRQLYGAV